MDPSEIAASAVAPGTRVAAIFNFAPLVGGTAILAFWVIVALLLRLSPARLGEIFRRTWHHGVLPHR